LSLGKDPEKGAVVASRTVVDVARIIEGSEVTGKIATVLLSNPQQNYCIPLN
jgi:hypothetical protein